MKRSALKQSATTFHTTVEPRVCAIEGCGREFFPRSSLHKVCSQRCATKLVKVSKKAERAELKARKQAIKTIPQLKAEAQREFNHWVRLRDAGRPCICCGKPLDRDGPDIGGGYDAGHYRSVGAAPHLRFDERNVHAQRKVCNRYGAGRAVEYRIGLIRRMGLEVVESLESSNTPHKWQADELRAIASTYRAKARELEKQLKESA